MCRIDPARAEEMTALRAEHLDHVIEHHELIHHGGLLSGPDGPTAICLFIRAESIEHARAIAELDPYCPLYESIEIAAFTQRIPERFAGELAELRQSASQAGGTG